MSEWVPLKIGNKPAQNYKSKRVTFLQYLVNKIIRAKREKFGVKFLNDQNV